MLQLYRILQRCQSLETANVELLSPIQPSEWEFSLPQLRELVLSTAYLVDAERFLQRISLNALVNLELILGQCCDTASSPTLSFPLLQRITIRSDDGAEPSGANLVSWLRVCGSAIEVLLPELPLPHSAIGEIAGGSLLPNVKLLIVFSADVSAMAAALAKWLDSPVHSTITEVGIEDYESWEDLDEDQLFPIFEMRERGVFLDKFSAGMFKLDYARGMIEHRTWDNPMAENLLSTLLTLVTRRSPRA
ncbi:hypothetical protein FB451DRAFT_441081 [Mycena latifolia]|nr:hypothetical protein FB451DRAFT_441081 [Mycena latifolia]